MSVDWELAREIGKWDERNANYEEQTDRVTTGIMRENGYWLDKETALRKPLGERVIRVTEADKGELGCETGHGMCLLKRWRTGICGIMWGSGCLATLIWSPYYTWAITCCIYAGFLSVQDGPALGMYWGCAGERSDALVAPASFIAWAGKSIMNNGKGKIGHATVIMHCCTKEYFSM